MKHIYTIISGYVEVDKKQCNIPFALIFENDGVLHIESFFEKQDFYDGVKGLNYYRLIGKTEKGYDIECEGLFCTRYKYSNQKVNFICDKYIKLVNNRDEVPKVENSTLIETPIYFSEIEGLKMHFGDHTETEQYRNSGKVDNLLNIEFDHTECSFVFNHPDFIGNHHKIVFFKNPVNKNILIDFRSPKGYSELTYKKYQIFKKDLLHFLSFINGSQVRLRKELLGETLKIKLGNRGFDAQTIIIYSYKRITENHCNDYLPVDIHHSYTSEIFHKAFLNGFDKFYHLNKTLDFGKLIFSLNSTNNVGLDERYFILITALERISKNYSKNNVGETKHLIDDKYFKDCLKPERKSLITKHKSEIIKSNKSAWNIFNSKIGDLNRRNISETSQKLYQLLNIAYRVLRAVSP